MSRDLLLRFLRAMQQEYGRRPATILLYRKNYGYFVGWLRGQGIKAETVPGAPIPPGGMAERLGCSGRARQKPL